MVITLPWPPSVNHAYYNYGHGKKRLKPASESYRDEVAYLSYHASQMYGIPKPPLILVVAVWKPDRRKRDLDNLTKVLQDGIFMGLHMDDSNVSTVVLKHRGYVKKGKLEVLVSTDNSDIWYEQHYKYLDSNPLQDLVLH
jgi:crossover junction endodeoxyribonuclease RusA